MNLTFRHALTPHTHTQSMEHSLGHVTPLHPSMPKVALYHYHLSLKSKEGTSKDTNSLAKASSVDINLICFLPTLN